MAGTAGCVNDENWQVNIYDRASIWGHRPSGRPEPRAGRGPRLPLTQANLRQAVPEITRGPHVFRCSRANIHHLALGSIVHVVLNGRQVTALADDGAKK